MSRKILNWEFPVFKALSKRPTLIFNKPPIHEIFETQEDTYAYQSVEDQIKRVIDEKQRDWRNRGINEYFIRKATELSRNWALEMTRFHMNILRPVLPNEIHKKIEEDLYVRFMTEGMQVVAERWISTLTGR